MLHTGQLGTRNSIITNKVVYSYVYNIRDYSYVNCQQGRTSVAHNNRTKNPKLIAITNWSAEDVGIVSFNNLDEVVPVFRRRGIVEYGEFINEVSLECGQVSFLQLVPVY